MYTVELEPVAPVPRFRPGQFLHLALDDYEPGGFWPESRVFSIASSPRERDRLSITYAVKGSFTARMEDELAEGREVWVKLPYGEFVIDPSRDAVLFAGGTGVTAFTAFLQSLEPGRRRGSCSSTAPGPRISSCTARWPRPARRRCRRSRAALVAETSDGVLSVDAAWSAIEALDDPAFYVSGPPGMLAALSGQLLDRGVPDAAIRTDAWE